MSLKNIKLLYETREVVIKLFNDYYFLVSEAKHKEKLKAGNTSENLLNEIRQIIYSLYRGKEITKKVYNNIMNSIKL